MTKEGKWLAGVLVLLFSLSLLPARAGAAENLDCTFNAEMASLNLLKGASLSYADTQKAELEIRKNIITKVVECGIADARNLELKVRGIDSDNIIITRIQESITKDLEAAINYHQIQMGGVNDLNLTDSQNLARQILDWRSNDYKNLTTKAVNFLGWAKNQELVDLADSRLGQARRLIISFKLGNNEELVGFFSKAMRAVNEAKTTNNEVTQSFSLYSPPDATELIKSTLEELAVAYQNLFNFSDAFKKILPEL